MREPLDRTGKAVARGRVGRADPYGGYPGLGRCQHLTPQATADVPCEFRKQKERDAPGSLSVQTHSHGGSRTGCARVYICRIKWVSRNRANSCDFVWLRAGRHFNTWDRHTTFSARNPPETGEPSAAGGKETRDRQKSTGETGNSAERKQEAVVRPAHEEDPRASSSPPLPQKTARMKKMVGGPRERVVFKDSEMVQRD